MVVLGVTAHRLPVTGLRQAHAKRIVPGGLGLRPLADVLAAYVPPGQKPVKAPARKRSFVKEWKMEDLQPLLDQVGKGGGASWQGLAFASRSRQ